MNQSTKWIYGWQTVLIGLLVAPVFVSTAKLFQPPKHQSNLIFPIKYPQHYIRFDRQHTNSAKNLETLNSRSVLSSNDDLMHNAMVNAEKPVDTVRKMYRIEQLQQKQDSTIYNDQQLDAKNKNAFFDEDGNNVMRTHGQPGNVLSTQFMDGNKAMLKKNPTMRFSRYNRSVARATSFAEHLLNNLALNNAAVNFSQSNSPDIWLPLDITGTQYEYSLNRKTSNDNSDNNIRTVFPKGPQVIIFDGPTRIYGDGTESKFPPFLEFFVQRLQKYFSVYKYEDLSRPGLPSQIPSDVDNVTDTSDSVTVSSIKKT